MREIKISDELFDRASLVAKSEGYKTVELYVQDLITFGCSQTPDWAPSFPPEVWREIEESRQQARDGLSVSKEEIDAYFAKRSKEWQAKRAS